MTDTGYTPKSVSELRLEIKVDTSGFKLSELDPEQLRRFGEAGRRAALSMSEAAAALASAAPYLSNIWKDAVSSFSRPFPLMPPPESLKYDPAADRERALLRIANAYQVPCHFFDYVTAVADAAAAIDKFGLDINEYDQRRRQRRAIIILIVVMVVLTLAVGGAA